MKNMAELVGAVVDATVVVRILMTSGRLLSVVIVTIPAMHVATNITNQMMILQLCFSSNSLLDLPFVDA